MHAETLQTMLAISYMTICRKRKRLVFVQGLVLVHSVVLLLLHFSYLLLLIK